MSIFSLDIGRETTRHETRDNLFCPVSRSPVSRVKTIYNLILNSYLSRISLHKMQENLAVSSQPWFYQADS